MAERLSIVIEDEDNTTRVDPVTGTVETDQPDGGVVVNLDAHRPQADDDGDEDKWFANLAGELSEQKRATIAADLIEAIKADDTSRSEYLTNIAQGLKALGTKLEEPRGSVESNSSAVDGMSTVTNPLLLEAVLKGWATATGEFLPAEGPMKVKNDGEEDLTGDELADALERDMNHWFTTTAAEYYPDTSHMLLWGVYFGGSGFKKIYKCPMRRRPVSESVDCKDLIVSDTTKDFGACGRITHQIPMRPSVMRRMQLIGAYLDVPLTQPTPTPNPVGQAVGEIQGTSVTKQRPEDEPYTIWETQCELDIDEFVPAGNQFKGKRLPLPYRVTIDKDTQAILSLIRDWNEDDKECRRKRMYVKYPYVPGPGFYGTGLLNILGNASLAMTTAWREALDAGQFASFPGGVIDKAVNRQNSSDFRVGPGQFQPIELGGRPISQVIMGMPYRDVTPGLMGMIDRITQQAKEVGGVADIPSAEGIANVPVGTMLAQIEQATKVISAAHRGMHAAQALEFKLIIDLFREDPEAFWRANEVAPKDYWNEEKFLQALDDYNLVPASDPNVPSHIHRIAKALALVQVSAMPQFAPYLPMKDVLGRIMRVLREDIVLIDPPPQQQNPNDPAAVAAQAKLISANAQQQSAQVKAQQVGTDAQTKAAQLAVQKDIADTDLQKELVIHAADSAREAQADARDHALAVASQAADHGLAQQQHGLAVKQHGLEVAQAQHEAGLGLAQHALDVHQALNPPEPKNGGTSSS